MPSTLSLRAAIASTRKSKNSDSQRVPDEKGGNKRNRETYESSKLDLLEIEKKNKRDTGKQNAELHELAVEKMTLEIERLKQSKKYEFELYELELKKKKLDIKIQEFQIKSRLFDETQ